MPCPYTLQSLLRLKLLFLRADILFLVATSDNTRLQSMMKNIQPAPRLKIHSALFAPADGGNVEKIAVGI
jgi:hypothetical protein